MNAAPCPDCQYDVPLDWTTCPHCGRPARFPNVLRAELPEERQALKSRYEQARQEAANRGALSTLQLFETAAKKSDAVIARPIEEVMRLATSDKQLYATYYQLTQTRIPPGDNWDILRSLTDTALFGDRVKEHIRFAALSLDGEGLTNYGNCSIVLREDMIAHRASVFHENSVLFMKHQNVKISEASKLPAGFRAAWSNRHELCVAKVAARLNARTPSDQFPRHLLRQFAVQM